MNLTPALVANFKKVIMDPAANDLPFKPMKEYFQKSETVTAKHILAQEYMKIVNIPKLILYIIMDEEFGQCDGKDESGALGYHLSFVNPG